jgi:hypothetical protein
MVSLSNHEWNQLVQRFLKKFGATMTILYVQHDYAVFGFGETEEEAIAMAAEWLTDATGKQGCSIGYAESLLVANPQAGQMTLYETDETIPADAENWGGEELLDWYHDVA